MELLLTVSADAENPNAGDLRLDSRGDLVWTTDRALETAQRLRSRLRFFKAEWFLDLRQGIPYFQTVMQGADEATLRSIFGPVIRGTPGVQSLESLSIEVDRRRRTATLVFRCRLDTGKLFSSADFGPFLVDF